MASYQIEIERTAAKALAKLDREVQKRIVRAIGALAEEPRPAGAIKLTGADAFRIRVGNYRIVYLVEDAIRVVTVVRIGHRSDVYREN